MEKERHKKSVDAARELFESLSEQELAERAANTAAQLRMLNPGSQLANWFDNFAGSEKAE